MNCVQGLRENETVVVMYRRSPQFVDFDYFTLFFRERQRNVSICKMHVQSVQSCSFFLLIKPIV